MFFFVVMGAFWVGVYWLSQIGSYFDGPTETSPEVWVTDPVKRAKRLKVARADWKVSRYAMTRQEIDRITEMTPEEWVKVPPPSGPYPAVVNPNADAPTHRLVRCCPMHAPHWE